MAGAADPGAELATVRGCIQAVAVLVPLTGLAVACGTWRLKRWVQTRAWWPRALPLQKTLVKGFGYPVERITDEVAVESYAVLLLYCSHHLACGLSMLPVALLGWQGAGPLCRAAFVAAAMCDVALDIYDSSKHFVLFAFPSWFPWLGMPCPGVILVVLSIHHIAAVSMAIPMCVYHPGTPAFSALYVALLMAAGVSYLLGAFKFTLDTTIPEQLAKYRMVVVLQFCTILLTRGYIWATRAYEGLLHLRAAAPELFFCGCVAAVSMTLFNAIIIAEATVAAQKLLLPSGHGSKCAKLVPSPAAEVPAGAPVRATKKEE